MKGSHGDRDVDEPLRVELYMRRNAFGARTQQQRLFERVRRLEARSQIERTELRRWPDRIPADERSELGEVIRAFEAWAADRDLALAPCFDRREVESRFASGRYERISLPIMCLAVYRNGRLQRVAPHVDGDRSYTVYDCIDDIEARLAEEDGRSLRRSDVIVPP